ncbi:MAG: hypothetical protein LBR53_10735 [Deltaproteobacteria bacterium]|jgi:hypothetical protein|nr:hypothetical protein [Deltaproteobacteria bacterium]
MREIPAILKITTLLLTLLFYPSCVTISDSVTDYMNDEGNCRPVTENCLGSPEKFFAQPQMRALETWRGRNAEELVTAWGQPDRVDHETGGVPGERYVYVEEIFVEGENPLLHERRFDDWDYSREPSRRYRCETYMLIHPGGSVTPLWVNRYGVCTRFFNPRPSAPPREAAVK